MKKFYLFILTILTFGLFLVPSTFAKDLNANTLDAVNIVNNVTFDDELREVYIECSFNDYFKNTHTFNSSTILHFTISFFDSDLNIMPIPSNTFSIYNYNFNNTGSHTIQLYNDYFYRNEYSLPIVSSADNLKSLTFSFIVNQQNVSYYDFLKTCYFQVMANIGGSYPISYSFIGNTYYNIGGFNYRGVFQYTTLDLIMQYTNSTQDISAETMGYNVITFDEPLITQISNNNDTNTYQYYLRLNINMAIKDFVNLKFSYLELSYISINGVRYDYATARQQYNFIYNNIVLYDSNSTLFVNGFDLLNSEYSDYVIDYIDFRIADYTFKSSTYYNSNLGIKGYIQNTSISIYEYNLRTIYDNGYQDGSNAGYNSGYTKGKADGIASNKTGFDNLMFAIADVPMKIISSMLNFELLGFNLMYFFMGIITLVLFVKLMQKFKE